MDQTEIHPSAIISPSAELGARVKIGPFVLIGAGVSIGNDTEIMHHTTIDQQSRIGQKCKIFPYSSIGTEPQDLSFQGESTCVEIGDHNIIREFNHINRGTQKGGGITRIGDNNYLMAYVHIAHDCQIGNNTQFLNGATLAGHVEVEDFAIVGAFCSVNQFVRIGRNAYIGGYTIVLQDILPFAKIAQARDNYNLFGPNSIGMMRNGISREFINKVKDLFEIIYRSDLNTSQSREKVEDLYPDSQEARIILEFITKSKRGILKNFTSKS